MKWTYFLVDFFTVIIPFVFSFHPRIQFHKNFLPFLKASLITAAIFLCWDAVFTSMEVWSFNAGYILGIRLYNLPIEEILFFFCIPFACLFTYHCLSVYKKIMWQKKVEIFFVLFFSIALAITGLVYWQKIYTSATFISTAVLLLILKFSFKVVWLPQLFTAYTLLLFPFFIVNGILTGTGLEHPVVIYNDVENLGIRLLTIPVEDIFYGFELILLNLFFYQRFLRKEI